ncbi:TetR/AcrR family transcriptional regulator [Roseomonas nepalensis]|uniref:TetR/AcrR family transcriptional regulator n=1 Tax=Muricoccus nepalensis TaxID=1854500 RepID=A0A502GE71_9PROT|nr:TetR/AcrR family transcriptional regulator [Roseomonas nepalensis]TPG59828.1 TetR/AcrR family transcriptional regulator [Roseomonas nepalensis]
MGRIAGSSGARTAASIRRAGLRLIYRRGFEAMSLRELAAEVGIQAASLYNHIRTKQDLLFDLIREHMERLLAHTDLALAAAPAGAEDRLRAFVASHVTYHLERKHEVFVANFELRALDPRHFAAIVALRRAYEEKLVAVLDLGVARGEFRIGDTRITAYAILAMLTGACTWYKPEGRLTKQEVVALHTGLVMHGCLGLAPTEGRSGTGLAALSRDS